MPPEQMSPDGQAWAHEPQFALSVARSRQTPEHAVRPVWHEMTHWLLAHTWPGPHLVPHAPQLATSDVRSRHEPAQFVRPAWHETTHALDEHTWPDAQAWPQAPQLASVFVGVSQPSAALWLQSP